MPETTVQFSKTKKTLNLRRGKSRGRQKRLVHAKHAASYSWPWNGILLIDNPSSPLVREINVFIIKIMFLITNFRVAKDRGSTGF